MIDDAYKVFVSEHPCALCGHHPPNDPHHLRARGTNSHKRNDATCAPMCRECHNLIHAVGLGEALKRRGVPIWQLVETVANLLVSYYSVRKEVGI